MTKAHKSSISALKLLGVITFYYYLICGHLRWVTRAKYLCLTYTISNISMIYEIGKKYITLPKITNSENKQKKTYKEILNVMELKDSRHIS